MKKYRSKLLGQEIDQVEVERETESSVWICGRKHSKVTDYECFHDTFEEAKSKIITRCRMELDRTMRCLKLEEEKLAKAQNLLPQ